MSIADLVERVPVEVWHVCWTGAGGYLPDGMPAKTPCSTAYDLEDFADTETFAVRVACILKYYHFLSADLAMHFGEVLDEVSRRAEEIVQERACTLPGFAQPQSSHWKQPICDVRDLGVFLSGQYMHAVCEFSLRMWRRDFSSLRLNDKAFALHILRVQDIKQVAKESALDGLMRKQARAALQEAISNIAKLSRSDDVHSANVFEAVAEFNKKMTCVEQCVPSSVQRLL
jgi:hypothetical protein